MASQQVQKLLQFRSNETTIFVFGQVADLMFGWTFLLIWADRDPVNRRKVLMLTIFVIGGMLLTSGYIMCIGVVPESKMIGLVVWQVILLVIFAAGYVTAGNLGIRDGTVWLQVSPKKCKRLQELLYNGH